MYEYKLQVTNVVDGDTVDGIIDLGMNIKTFKRIRLFAINAPEVRTLDLKEKEKGLETKHWLEERLKDKAITIRSHKDKSGKYGRLLGSLYIDDININMEMVELNLATMY